MKRITLMLAGLLLFAGCAHKEVRIATDEGTLVLRPLLDNAIRPRVKATPWRSEWLDADLASHQYGLLRLSGGLHYHGSGLWLFSAYVHDFEENPTADLGKHKFIFEPALRLSYKSISVYAGLSRIVDNETLGDLKKFKDYDFFIRIGNYDLF